MQLLADNARFAARQGFIGIQREPFCNVRETTHGFTSSVTHVSVPDVIGKGSMCEHRDLLNKRCGLVRGYEFQVYIKESSCHGKCTECCPSIHYLTSCRCSMEIALPAFC
jgi:hypothetical protein